MVSSHRIAGKLPIKCLGEAVYRFYSRDKRLRVSCRMATNHYATARASRNHPAILRPPAVRHCVCLQTSPPAKTKRTYSARSMGVRAQYVVLK